MRLLVGLLVVFTLVSCMAFALHLTTQNVPQEPVVKYKPSYTEPTVSRLPNWCRNEEECDQSR